MIGKLEYEELAILIEDIVRFDLLPGDPRILNACPNVWGGTDIILGNKQLTIAPSQDVTRSKRIYFTLGLHDGLFDCFDILEQKKPNIKKMEHYIYDERQQIWMEYDPNSKRVYRAHLYRHTIKKIAEHWAGLLIHGIRFIDYDNT